MFHYANCGVCYDRAFAHSLPHSCTWLTLLSSGFHLPVKSLFHCSDVEHCAENLIWSSSWMSNNGKGMKTVITLEMIKDTDNKHGLC